MRRKHQAVTAGGLRAELAAQYRRAADSHRAVHPEHFMADEFDERADRALSGVDMLVSRWELPAYYRPDGDPYEQQYYLIGDELVYREDHEASR